MNTNIEEDEFLIGTGDPFFTDADFDAFDPDTATVAQGPVIAARKRVRQKLLDLHDTVLGPAMALYDLHSHWKRDYVTNVFYPSEAANNGWVDYMRLGYGKERRLVQELTERGAFNTELTAFGSRDMISFFMTSQVQLGIHNDGWWINFYLHDKAWLEQKNLLAKGEDPFYRQQLAEILEPLQDAGYELVLYEGWGTPEQTGHPSAPSRFLDDIAEFHGRNWMVHMAVERAMTRDSTLNDEAILPQFVQAEMERLIPLYRFVSWDPERNNYLGL